MLRRTLLQMLAGAAAWLRLSPVSFAQTPGLSAVDEAALAAIAEVVLPTDIGPARAGVVNDFLRWVRGYREGAELDPGYGFPALRRAAASPASRYPAQLAALQRAARARGAVDLAALEPAARRDVVQAAITSTKVERLPVRPNGDHVAVDLMAFYFNGHAANDLAYGAAIGRDQCRGLPSSDERPAAMQTPFRGASESAASPFRVASESAASPFRVASESVATASVASRWWRVGTDGDPGEGR